MKRLFLLTLALLCLPLLPAEAQTLVKKDGTTLTYSNPLRQGDTVAVTVTISGATAQISLPVSDLAQLNFPKPPILDAAPTAIAKGDAAKALADLEPVVKEQGDFRDIPGNWWPQVALEKATALAALKRPEETKALLADLAANTKDAAILQGAKSLGLSLSAEESPKAALDAYEALIKENGGGGNSAVLALAWLSKGKAHYALEQYDEALMDFLTVTVFYSEQAVDQPPAVLGSARAYVKLQEPQNAMKAFQQIVDTWPDSPEAMVAKAELKKGKL